MDNLNLKVLVTGASGYVGRKIYNDLSESGYNVYGTYFKNKIEGKTMKGDLTNEDEVKNILRNIKPDVILHLAADAHSKSCELDPDNARKINVDSTKFIVDYAKKHKKRVIYLSTFACFNPTNIYGKTKFEAEEIVKQLDNYVIVRASVIVGKSPYVKPDNFFNILIDSFKQKKIIELDDSWKFEPTYLNHLSILAKELIDRKEVNKVIVPVTVGKIISKYKIGSDIGGKLGIKVEKIDEGKDIPVKEYDSNVLNKYNLPMCSYDECIDEILKEVVDII